MAPEQNNIIEAWTLNVNQRLSEVVPKKVSRREQVLGNRGKTLYNMEANIKTPSNHARSFAEGKLTDLEEPL